MKTMHYREFLEELPVKITACRDPEVREHRHTFLELVYVRHGKAEHICEQQSTIIRKGDFFLIDLNKPHEYRRIGNDDSFCIINCLFLPCFLDESLPPSADFGVLTESPAFAVVRQPISVLPAQKIFHENSDTVGTLMERMLLEFEEKKVGYLSMIRCLLTAVLLQLLRNEVSASENSAARTVREIRAYAETEFSSSLRLSDIAERLNFSVPYISALFHRECGITFRDYLIRVRIEKACLLLRSTEKTVAQIAEQVGYTDPAFFYKSFRREMDMTPDDYRRHYR